MRQTWLLVALVSCVVTTVSCEITTTTTEPTTTTTTTTIDEDDVTTTVDDDESTAEPEATAETTAEAEAEAEATSEPTAESSAEPSAEPEAESPAATTPAAEGGGSATQSGGSAGTAEPSDVSTATAEPGTTPATCLKCAQCQAANDTKTCVSSSGICLMSFNLITNTTERGCKTNQTFECHETLMYPNGLARDNLCGFCCRGNSCNDVTIARTVCSNIAKKGAATQLVITTLLLPLMTTLAALIPKTFL